MNWHKNKRFRSHKEGSEHGHDLLITPLLDLFVALIPFLIMSVVLTRINTLDIALSQPGSSPQSHSEEKGNSILLKVFTNRAELSVDNKVYYVIPRSNNSNNWRNAVHADLVAIKKEHPKEMRLYMEAGEQVHLDVLMGFMDAARELKSTDKEITRKDGDKEVRLRYLFPKIILKGVYS